MPRSSSSSGGARPTAVARVAPVSPLALPRFQPSLPAVTGRTLGLSIKDGFGLGVGSSLGHRAVGWMFGPPAMAVAGGSGALGAPAAPADLCATFKEDMDACFKFKDFESHCFEQMRSYKECLQTKH